MLLPAGSRAYSGMGGGPVWSENVIVAYMFPFLAGLRRGDNMRMAWDDLDLASEPATLVVRGGKAKKRVGILPLHDELVRELRELKPVTALPSVRVFPTAVTHATRRRDFVRACTSVQRVRLA